MKVLNLLASGGTGGIEVLCKDIALNSNFENTFCFLFKEGGIYEELKKSGVKLFSLKDKNRKIINIVNEIIKFSEQEKIDIIAVHHGGLACNIVYILLQKKLKHIKFVRFLHGCYAKDMYGNNGKFLNDFIVKFFMKKALNKSDLIISVSKAVEKSFEQNFNLTKKNKVVIYNGISKRFFEKKLNKKAIYDKDIIKIVYVGRVEKVKGVDILIDAFSDLISYIPNLELTIVGDGSLRENLEQKVKKLKIMKNVIFAGNQLDVIPWLDEADIFVYPVIWEEAFGIAVAEAMARGCIPVVSNKGGLPEVIGNDERYLFENKSQLKEKIINIINNKEPIDQTELINKAKKFKITSTVSQLKKRYEKLIKEE